MSELQSLQKQLEAQLKSNPAKEMAIAEAMKAEPMQSPARMMRRLQEAVAQIPRTQNAPGAGEFMVDQFKKYGVDIAGKSENEILDLSKKFVEARRMAPNEDAVKARYQKMLGEAAPMETPYGKSLLSYTPEGKIAGKAGSMLRGLGRVAGPLGAALTALDLAQGLGEVQDKGAAKIAEDYKKSKMAESEAEILTPEADQFRESLKSRRTELEILRAELERKRKEEERAKERENKGMERQARVRDTLEQTGLVP